MPKIRNKEALDRFVKMKRALMSIEEELGLEGLNDNEVKILCASFDLLSKKDKAAATTSAIQEHEFCQKISQSTFYRCLASLVEKGFLHRGKGQENFKNYDISMSL